MPPKHRTTKTTSRAKRRKVTARKVPATPRDTPPDLGLLLRKVFIAAAKKSSKREEAAEKRKLRRNGLGSYHNPVEIVEPRSIFKVKVEEVEEEDVVMVGTADALAVAFKLEEQEWEEDDAPMRMPGDTLDAPIKIEDDAPPHVPALRSPGRRRGYENLTLIGRMVHDFRVIQRVAERQDQRGRSTSSVTLAEEAEDESWIDDDGPWNNAIWVSDPEPPRHGLLGPLREDQRVWMSGVITSYPHDQPPIVGPSHQPPRALGHEPPRLPPVPVAHFKRSLCSVEFFGTNAFKPERLIRYVRFWAWDLPTAYTNDDAMVALQELHEKGCVRILEGDVMIRNGRVRLDETPFLIEIED
ncbi:hypothetical protein NX059_004024 [Plenodomus lindquistii]|nr:hypothetical protein NX059_004024 [Plenodomus lindquistii]